MRQSILKYLWNMLTPADKILILFLLALSSLSWLGVNHLNTTGTWVRIWVDNQEIGHFSIHKDQMIHLHGPLGETYVQIKENQVKVVASACPNKICYQMGEIHRTGQVLVCVPNRVVVKIVGESETVSWDVITE